MTRRSIAFVAVALAVTGLLAATALTAGAKAPARVKVTLTADNAAPTAGDPVSLVAKAPALPRGDRLLVQERSQGTTVWASVAECAARSCTAAKTEPNPTSDAFRTIAIQRKHGAKGPVVKMLGASRTVAVTWVAATQPPPPAATPGHYAGTTGDNEQFSFDIGSDGLSLLNLQTGQINESCDPPAYLSGGNLHAAGPIPVAADGSFSINATINGTADGNPSTDKVVITGHIANGTASGTYREDTSFTDSGTAYSCNSGDQTWTASKT